MNVFAVKKESILQLWWIMVLFGLLLFGMGIFSLFLLSEEHFIESLLFSFIMLASGFLEILFALSNKRVVDNWEWYLVNGLIDVLIGAIIIWMPDMEHTLFSFIMAFRLLYRGISFFSIYFTTKVRQSPYGGWLLLVAVIAILNAICLVVLPIAYHVSVDLMNSLTVMMLGIIRVAVGLRVRNLNILYINFPMDFVNWRIMIMERYIEKR